MENKAGHGDTLGPWPARGHPDGVGGCLPKQRHGRRELSALSDPEFNGRSGAAGMAGEAWPHLQQACRVERRRMVKGRSPVSVSYAVTSLPPTAAGADRLLQRLRERWHIENRVHWVPDVTFDEDRCRIRIASALQVMAALRNLTAALVRWAGHSNVAAALRRHAAHISQALALLGIACDPGQ